MKIREENCKIRVGLSVSLGCDNGNVLYRHDGVSAWNYTYDPLNQLKTVTRNGTLTGVYEYDAEGRRVRTWDSIDGTIDYVFGGLSVLDEVSNSTHEKHIYAGGMHIASNTTGTVEYYHVDHLGSTRLKTAENGSAIYKSNYEPFGSSSRENGDEDYRYTGKHEDPTGLYYYGARYYDPETGRFTTRDMIKGDLTVPQSLNRYVYCNNNPNKYTDPDGNEPITAAIAIGGTLGFLSRLTLYALDCAITGEAITMKGVAKAGVTGFIGGASSAVAAIAGPIGGVAIKAIGSSFEHMANQVIEGEDVTVKGVVVAGIEGAITKKVSNTIGIPYIAKGMTMDEHLRTLVKTTIINPSVGAAKSGLKEMTSEILSNPDTYNRFKPIEYYDVTHGHDPWVYGR